LVMPHLRKHNGCQRFQSGIISSLVGNEIEQRAAVYNHEMFGNATKQLIQRQQHPVRPHFKCRNVWVIAARRTLNLLKNSTHNTFKPYHPHASVPEKESISPLRESLTHRSACAGPHRQHITGAQALVAATLKHITACVDSQPLSII